MGIFLGEEIQQSPINSARFSVLPAPYERSVSYGSGTARAPKAIISASNQLETLVVNSDGIVHPCESGIHTCEEIDCSQSPQLVVDEIAHCFNDIITAKSIPVMLGGEHTVTYGAALGLLAADIGPFGVVQIDAHADLRDAYEADPYSHASVMKRIVDKSIPIFQLGVRAFCDEEREVRLQNPNIIHYCDAIELMPNNTNAVIIPEHIPDQVYLTFDIDGLDPSIMPATGTPVQGGLGWYQALNLVRSVAQQRKIVGFDVVEFAPIDNFHAYDFTAAQLVYQIMAIICQYNRN